MITPQQLTDESNKLVKLMDDPRFQKPGTPSSIAFAINTLAWVNDGDAPPPSQILMDQMNQGLI